MKKSYIKIMAAAASVFLFACCQENEIGLNDPAGTVGENSIAFAIGSPSTRSAVAVSDITEQGAIISLGTDENGTSFYLEESVIDLNSPVTRGTPVYTENVVTMYPKLYAHSALDGRVTGCDTVSYVSPYYTSVNFNENIWKYGDEVTVDGKKTQQLKFWMYMPYNMSKKDYITSTPAFTFGGEESGAQTISFGYKSPATAAEQDDIIFSARAVTEAEYNTNEKVVDVLFHHALTGVKFAIANPEAEGITITGVSFTGLSDNGNCVVTPTTEGNPGVYQDVATEYSSQKDGVVEWKSLGVTPNYTISATFTGTTTFAKPAQGEKTGSFTSKGEYPESFSAAGNENNLNDGDATQTFWLIPQTLTENVKLTIVYYVGDVKEENKNEWTVDFGTALANPTWKAGQIRTYTIKVDEVNVKIEDAVTIGQGQTDTYTDNTGATHTIYGGTKSGITITNTGNTDAFIRAAITGQWVDANGAPVFSFTDFGDEDGDIIKEIDSWYNDQFGTGTGKFGVFEGLVGYTKNGKSGAGNTGWLKGKDGYYYYTTKVAPNAATGTSVFNSYTVTLANVPKIKVAGALQEVHFVMEISTQAISAKQLDGSDYDWDVAWNNALGYDPSDN